jgi:beta-mannosidase
MLCLRRQFPPAARIALRLVVVVLGVAAGNGRAAEAVPPPSAPQTIDLNGSWSVRNLPLALQGEDGYQRYAASAEPTLAARVPGEVHDDLIRASRMPDPDISDNARTQCRWPEKFSWWYRREFSVPADFRRHLEQKLVLAGIDLSGQVFVNGKLVGSTKDAFTTYEFDVGGLLRDGANELVVRVTSGTELVPPGNTGTMFRDIYSIRNFEQRRLLRKPAYAYGWDWCDPLPNIGIIGGVRLEGRSQVVIRDLRMDTVIDGDKVSLEGTATLQNLHPTKEIPAVLELSLDPPQGDTIRKRFPFSGQLGRSTLRCRLEVPDPQLWWPNGMGGQPLYKLTARVVCDGRETDRSEQMIGLRTIELDRSALAKGSRFAFRVNGQTMFSKGGNWAPADLIPARVSKERYRALVAEAKNANFNMFRVNGVGLYESDAFYDACDRAGILVWQDFTLSFAVFPDDDPAFVASVRAEAESQVTRLRHHASLAMWCGNNECLWLLVGAQKDPKKAREVGGTRLYYEVLPGICSILDPGRPYWPGSPAGGDSPNSEEAGDCHWWMDFTMSRDMNRRIRSEVVDECRARFVSEYGILGPPNMASIREFLKPGEVSLTSEAWKIHTNSIADGTITAGIAYHYGTGAGGALSLDEFVLYGQMVQAVLQGGTLEALRFRKDDPVDDCHGALVWSYNDCWGETGWSIIDHYVRRKASYYWFKRAAAPVKVIVRPRGDELVTRVVNDTIRAGKAVVSLGWIRLDGTAREMRDVRIKIPANGMVEVARDALPRASMRNPREWIYAAVMRGDGIPDDQAIWLLAPQRELALARPAIAVAEKEGMLEVKSDVYCHAVHLEDGGKEIIADNYFDLLPGIPVRVAITTPTANGSYPLAAVMPLQSSNAGQEGAKTH